MARLTLPVVFVCILVVCFESTSSNTDKYDTGYIFLSHFWTFLRVRAKKVYAFKRFDSVLCAITEKIKHKVFAKYFANVLI